MRTQSQTQIPVSQMRDARMDRALREINSYRFIRLSEVSVEVRSGSGNTYVVTQRPAGKTCTCQDFIERCVGTETRCKHCYSVEFWENTIEPKNKALTEESRRAEIRRTMKLDFPED